MKRFLTFLFLFSLALNISILGKMPADPNMEQVTVIEHLDETLPLDATFMTHDGEIVPLSQFFDNSKTPVILSLAYYSCPMLCNVLTQGLVDGLSGLDLDGNTRFRIITLSFNQDDTVKTASEFRNRYLPQLQSKWPNIQWDFLIGTPDNIELLTRRVGFQYKKLENGEFSHTAALIMTDPKGTIRRYLYGIDFKPFDLKMGLVEAMHEQSRTTVERALLFCYNYDPHGRGYSLAAFKLMRVGAVVALLILAGFIFQLKRQERHHKK